MVDDISKRSDSAPNPFVDVSQRRSPPTIDLEASHVTDAATASEPGNVKQASSARGPLFRVVMSAVVGAAVIILLGGGVWLGGWLSNPNSLDVSTIATLETLAARVSRLENAPASPPNVVDPALVTRVDAMEKSLTLMRDELNMLRAQNERTVTAIDEIKSTPRDVGVGDAGVVTDLSSLEDRIGRLEAAAARTLTAESTSIKSVQEDNSKLPQVERKSDSLTSSDSLPSSDNLSSLAKWLDRLKASAAGLIKIRQIP